MKIGFYGAAGMVTGSNHYLEIGSTKILIDCGLFQGNQETERMNEIEFAYNPKEIDFLLLTHAHIDHSGRIPLLTKRGFNGQIITSNASYELCKIMLKDSAKIQSADVEWENRKRQRAGLPMIEPIYTMEDVDECLKQFKPYHIDQIIKLNDEITIRFKDAGHLLGAVIIEIWAEENDEKVKIVFTGDLGLPNRPILNDPAYIDEADYLIMESTYGDKNHPEYIDNSRTLINIVIDTYNNGGTVIIPSFAVGRTQEIIYQLNEYFENLSENENIKNIPIYVDSPMAVEATKVFQENASYFDQNAKELILKGDNPFSFENLYYIREQSDSVALNTNDAPKVIISSSGMANAGRVRHHLKHNLWKPNTSLVFVGYQAEGTLGRILLDGVKKVKILGEDIHVNAKIYDLEGFSAHADQNFLLEWLDKFKVKPKKIFIVHGEHQASTALATLIRHIYKIETVIPRIKDIFSLNPLKLYEHGELNISKEEQIRQLNDEFIEAKEQFDALWDDFYNNNNLKDDNYYDIKNKIIELQHILMDLNIKKGK